MERTQSWHTHRSDEDAERNSRRAEQVRENKFGAEIKPLITELTTAWAAKLVAGKQVTQADFESLLSGFISNNNLPLDNREKKDQVNIVFSGEIKKVLSRDMNWEEENDFDMALSSVIG